MVELAAVFWFVIILFGIIGLMRGWVREIQVTAAIVLAMFIIEQFGPWLVEVLVNRTSADIIDTDPMGTLRRVVMLKAAVLLIVVFFGYQGPMVINFAIPGRTGAARARETLQEGLLGLVAGMLNGYLIFGALWWYAHTHSYPFGWILSPEVFPNSPSAGLIPLLPLSWLASPWLEILVVVFFLIVIIVIL